MYFQVLHVINIALLILLQPGLHVFGMDFLCFEILFNLLTDP